MITLYRGVILATSQVNYTGDGADHTDTVVYEQSIRSTISAMSIRAACGAIIETLLKSLSSSPASGVDGFRIRTVIASVLATFLLKYGDLLIGTLMVEDETWHFEYSEEFKRQEQLRPLIEFPELEKSYQSKELWQFFAMRIPSAEQPEVEEIIQREKIPEDDAVRLLKRFGARTIANPFELTLAA